MKRTLLAAVLLWPSLLMAELKLFVVEPGAENAVGDSFTIPTTAAGDYTDTVFRLRNTGSSAVSLYGLNVAGSRFTFASLPTLPVNVASNGTVDFTIRFQPVTSGTYSAYLNVNGSRLTVLVATAGSSYVVTLTGESTAVELRTGNTVDFGTVTTGSSASRQFSISNPTSQPVTINAVTVSGDSFAGPDGVSAPLVIEAGASVSFGVAFAPTVAEAQQGALTIDHRSFTLSGAGKAAVFPKLSISLTPETLTGGKQVKVRISLESKSESTGAGKLSVAFTPDSSTSGDDPALLFPASGSRSIAFTVTEGEELARFSSLTETEFQTGTTAGSIVFTATLGSHTETLTVTIPAASVAVDSAKCLRGASSLDLQISGFDTSQSASRLTFRFYDLTGTVISPGSITVDAESAFKKYFSSATLGGQFLLRAVFPVNGNVLQVGAFEATVTNSIGTVTVPRTAVQQ
ncbi:MAG: choice-of-anchor D domain-containing protein [Bryobacteraceae bacterium]